MKRGGPLKRKTPIKPGKPLRRAGFARRSAEAEQQIRAERTRRENPRYGHVKKSQYGKVRKWVRDRANDMCEARIADVCAGRGAHAHHILMRSQGGTDDMGNLIWVCPPCHGHIHENPAESYEAGFLRKRGAA